MSRSRMDGQYSRGWGFAHPAMAAGVSVRLCTLDELVTNMNELGYQSGFGNEFASEALPGALPVGRNSPQLCPYGLYAEQFSGTAFTAPRATNRRSWLYRIRPAAMHEPFVQLANDRIVSDFDR